MRENSWELFVRRLQECAVRGDGFELEWLPLPGRLRRLPRVRFAGPPGGGDPVRIGIFGGIHGDEPAGARAVVDFIETVRAARDIAAGYELHCYPACNPDGCVAGSRCSPTGADLNREFWRGSSEPEVMALEAEIRSARFHGMISLHSDDTSDGIYGFVRGAVLTRALLEPALNAAERFLPRNRREIIDGFPAKNGIISVCYDGILTSPPELELDPFEIILETPHAADESMQSLAFCAALETVLVEYQEFLAFATNL